MQNDPRFFMGQGSHGYAYGMDDYHHAASMGGYYAYGSPVGPSFGINAAAAEHGGILNGVELQASGNCPENYLIFDQTGNRSRIMYNPAFGPKVSYPGYEAPTGQVQGGPEIHDYDARAESSSLKEDSDDIDALLSIEDEEDEDDDVVSTGRTPSYRCNSPDSICSTGGLKTVKQNHATGPRDSAVTAGTSNERKKGRMKKMVKTLRGIVPGGQQMDTPAFLDEAVRYLKSLKVEVRKLGIKN